MFNQHPVDFELNVASH